MDHNRPSEGWIDHFDLLEEFEHADGGERNSKVRPAGEVELGDRAGSLGSIAGLLHGDTNIVNSVYSISIAEPALTPGQSFDKSQFQKERESR